MCTAMSSSVGNVMFSGESVRLEFNARPRRSSFGESYKFGNIRSDRFLIAASRWSGQLLGMSFFAMRS